ncbi:MAG TPA: DUF3160 domain-containing protein, partial [Polyangium sp.]|nr:DUF3160 domain-containing protein [Polyangium sp.]
MRTSNHLENTFRIVGLLGTLAVANCVGSKPAHIASPKPAVIASSNGPAGQVVAKSRPEDIQFRAYAAAHPNLTAADVLATLPKRSYRETLDFDPTTVAYYGEVTDALQLTDDEKGILRKRGFVSVDIRQRLSMASAYYAIYTSDLPVLITTDSIAHALHRSFDEMLKTLEEKVFSRSLSLVLAAAHEQLVKESAGVSNSAVLTSARDVDLYLSVARALLEGTQSP